MTNIAVDCFEVTKVLSEDPFFCKQWKIFCGELKLSNSFLNDLERQDDRNTPIIEITRQILVRWKATDTEASLSNLSAKLLKIDCNTSSKEIATLAATNAPDVIVSSQIPGTSRSGTQSQTATSSTTALELQQMRDALIEQSPFIVENLRNFHPLLIRLKAKRLISPDEVKRLRTFTGEEQVDELLGILGKQQSCTWTKLKNCLAETQNMDIIRRIEEN